MQFNLDLKLPAKPIQNLASSIWSHRILNAVLKGVGIYIAFTLVFGLIYFLSDSLDFKSTI